MQAGARWRYLVGSIIASVVLVAADRPAAAQQPNEVVMTTYGLLEYKNPPPTGPKEQIHYIGILWQRLLQQPGSVKDKVDEITGAGKPAGVQCGSLDSPGPDNTVLLEMSRDRNFFRGRYRAS